MKRIVSALLILVLVLALGAIAYADYGIVVTKHPTDETRTAGGTAWFVSGAQFYETLDWTFVDPTGHEYTVQQFRNMFPYVTVEGEYSTNLTVRNLSLELNGWAVFCNFHSSADNAKTNWAFFHVNTYTAPAYAAPSYGYYQDGNTTYYWDGTSLTTFWDGTMMYTGTDGSTNFAGTDGSYFRVYPDGSWDSYDASTGTYDGGMIF